MNETIMDWRSRAESLAEAARDMRRDAPPEPPCLEISAQHATLFEKYVLELGHAKKWADSWWESLVKTEAQRTHDSVSVERVVRIRNPVGPVAHPGVIAVIRKYWLACAALNAELPSSQRMPPGDFLLGLLLRSPHQELGRFLSALPFWPIGMDADGRWV